MPDPAPTCEDVRDGHGGHGWNGTCSRAVAVATIVIDPGHGGRDDLPGSSANNATGPGGSREKVLTLEVARHVVPPLRAMGHEVVVTRTDDTNLSAAERAAVARRAQADAFVSIHFNAAADASTQGTAVLVRPDDVELMNTLHDRSRRLAHAVRGALVEELGLPDLGLVPGKFAVLAERLHDPATARCLVETSYLSDPAEEQRLRSPQYRVRIGEALARGVARALAIGGARARSSLGYGDANLSSRPVRTTPGGVVHATRCPFPDDHPEDFVTLAAFHHVRTRYRREPTQAVRWRRRADREWTVTLEIDGSDHEFNVLWRPGGHVNVHGVTPPLDEWSCNYDIDCDSHDPTFNEEGCIIRNLTFG